MAVVMNDRHNAHAVDEAVNFWIVDLLAITAGVFFFYFVGSCFLGRRWLFLSLTFIFF